MRPKKKVAIDKIKKLIAMADEFVIWGDDTKEFDIWKRDVVAVLANSFGEGCRQQKEFEALWEDSSRMSLIYDIDKTLEKAKLVLESASREIKEYWEEDAPTAESARKQPQLGSKDVFLVHGHDGESKEAVARFINRLHYNAIILHEQPNLGRTIIEKFEDYAAPAFAVVLLTPDDTCMDPLTGQPLLRRARQNVVLELGFFIGALGRSHVCPLVKGDLELPSDYDGVLYVPLDDEGSWQFKLVKEMKAAGLDVDANLVVE